MVSGHAGPRAVIATKIAFTAIAGLLTFARLYTRTHVVRNAGWDDVFIGISLIASAILSVTTCMQVHYGMGTHTTTPGSANDSDVAFWFWIAIIVYSIALGCVKMSILLQYLRILPRSVRDGPMDERIPRCRYRTATFVLLAITGVFTIWAVLGAVLTCLPVRKFWHPNLSGKCMDRQTIWYLNSGFNIVTELCIAILPLPLLHSLRIPKRQKDILMIVFGMAGVTVVISILRLPFLYIISTTDDPAWDSPMASILSSLEVNIGIIASCIPTLNGLVSRMFPSFTPDEGPATPSDVICNRNAFDENAMEYFGSSEQHADGCSLQSSAGTATYLNATYFNATARLDD